MKTIRNLCLYSVIVAAFACGSSNDTTVAADQAALDNAPTDMNTMGLDQNPSDTNSTDPNYSDAPLIAELDPGAEIGTVEQAVGDPGCHPLLFDRMRRVVVRLNRLIAKAVGRAKKVVSARAKSSNGTTTVWVGNVDNNQLTVRVTVTKASAGNFTWTVDAKLPTQPDSAFVNFATGSVNNSGTAHSGGGSLRVDFTALNGVASFEKTTGTLTVNFTHQGNGVGAAKKVQLTLANYNPNGVESEPLGANANYVFERVVGTGGSFKAQWMPILACPQTGNPPAYNTTAKATVSVVHRWKVQSAGVDGGSPVINSRTDAYATGGQMAAGESFTGATCTEEGAGAGFYWMMRHNRTTAPLFVGHSASVGPGTCDTADFGTPPNLGDKNNDYIPTTAINFTDAKPVSFCIQNIAACTPPIQ